MLYPFRRFGLAVVPAALLAAGCQDFPPPTPPNPRATGTTTVGPTATRTVGWTGQTTAVGPVKARGGTFVLTNTVIFKDTRTAGVTVAHTATANIAMTVPPYGSDVKNGVPILEAILSNPIKAETEFRNRAVRLQGLGSVGKDDRG